MGLKDDFENAVRRAKELTERPSNEELLKMYGLYKQSTEGDNQETRPGNFDFKAIAKYEAWAKQKGKSKEQAQKTYVEFIERLSKR